MGNNYIKTRQGTFPVTVFEKDMYDVNLPKYLETYNRTVFEMI